MPRLEFERLDTSLVIGKVGRNEVIVARLGSRVVQQRLRIGPLPEEMRRRLCAAAPAPASATPDIDPIRRLTLDIRDPELHAHPWEEWLLPQTRQPRFDAVVRLSPVPARVAQITFTPPLRVLLCDVADPAAALDEIRALFGRSQPEERVAKAYAGAAVALQDIVDSDDVPQGWPVVDVLHLCRFPIAAPGVDTLSPYAGDRGSLGWLARALHAWQTRLLIIDVSLPDEARLARRLAAALVARGGPGVIVRPASEPAGLLYDRLVHDMALDAFTSPRSHYGTRPLPRLDSLFAGGGREELARASATVVALESLHHEVTLAQTHFAKPPLVFRFDASPPPRLAPWVRGLSKSRRSARELKNVVNQYSKWTFNLHESDGLLPMSESLASVRGATETLVRNSRARSRRVKSRYVNASLWRGASGAERVDAGFERLRVGSPYRLALQIGARDRLIPVYEASPFKEIPRIAGRKGVWVEVAVNGVGFAVAGDAVQELWLPFDEPSDELWFAVSPTREGVAVLRYTIYYRQNVVQTYRLAALTYEGGDDDVAAFDPTESRRQLARALHATLRRMPRAASYVTRLEYEAASLAQAAALPERRVSIVANDVDGERVITVKGRRFFFDSKPGSPNELVDAARNELFEISVNKVAPAREDWIASFGSNRAVNEKRLRTLLPQLALAGFRMYDKVFAKAKRDQLAKDLAGADAKITVAHTLLDDVVPWALMYDRPYTDKPAPGSRLEVCTAALPGAKGQLAVNECGQSPNCVLHQPGLVADNVACPLRFWGFRHQIEVPPKQTSGSSDNTQGAAAQGVPPAPGAAAAPAAPRLAAVMNAALATADAHAKQLRKLELPGGGRVVWQQIETQPDHLIQALGDSDLDLVYLYCHARGGVGDPEKTKPPMLEFSDKAKTYRYAAAELQMVWRRRPLVIVNGCSTAAFTPDALSPFIEKFTRDCEAGGVIGTEIPVHEDLAVEFITRLLARVLAGEAVGAALLAVRRELLAEDNPLGLAYTLYAFSEFRLGAR